MSFSYEGQDNSPGTVESISLSAPDHNQIDHLSEEYQVYMFESQLARTLLGGTVAMRAAGKTYLPINKFESDEAYKKRIARSFLFNAFKQTVSFLSGQVFQERITMNEDNEEGTEFINQYSTDIDNYNNDLNVFLKRLFWNGVGKGCSHILVEMPNKEAAETKQDELDKGIRPFFREIRSEDVIGFRLFDDGTLSQLRIKGTRKKDIGDYGTEVIKTVLLLKPGKWDIYEETDENSISKTPIESGTTNLDYIPFVSFIPGESDNIVFGKSPLDDLTFLNLKHWQSASDQTNILHIGRVGILFGKNLDAEQIVIGTGQVINSNDEHGDLKFVEITGASIEAGRQDLEDTKTEMSVYGMQQLEKNDVEVTATQTKEDTQKSNSNLSTWVVEFEDFMNTAIAIMGDFMGVSFDEKVTSLNKDYSLGYDSATLEIILKAVDMRVSSRKMAFEELKKRGVYDVDSTWEDVSAEIEEDARSNTSFSELSGEFLK